VRVWNVQTGECTHILNGHTAYVEYVAFNGTKIISGSRDKTVRIWHAPYNSDKCERVIEGHTHWVARVWLCKAPNEHIAVSVDGDRRVHVHDLHTGNLVCAPIECYYCKLSQQSGVHHFYRRQCHGCRRSDGDHQ
jgi:WD40 repeat protein